MGFLSMPVGTLSRAILGWDLSKISKMDHTALGINFEALHVSPDASLVFFQESISGSAVRIHKYELSTPGDFNTATAIQTDDITVDPGGGDISGSDASRDLYFDDTGTRMLLGWPDPDASDTHKITMWDLSTAWDPSTASRTATIDANDTAYSSTPGPLWMNPDGDWLAYDYSIIDVETLSTPWDLTTATHQYTVDINPRMISGSIKSDGKVVIAYSFADKDGNAQESINKWELSTAWDLTTATPVRSFDVSSAASDGFRLDGPLAVSGNGKYLFIREQGSTEDLVHWYSLF